MMMPSGEGDINSFNDDIMHKIFTKLPAESFAASACVSKNWNRLSSQVLSRPKLASALSVNPSTLEAVAEVLDKVLSKPIRPHFAIACISEQYALGLAHLLLSQRLGSNTPLVTHISNGVMGKDVLTDQMKEVQWEYFDYSCRHPGETDFFFDSNQGIVLVVGYLPGLKVDAIPLFRPKDDFEAPIDYDEFVKEIKRYTAAVSNAEFPDAIMMFGDLNYDASFTVSKLDKAMPKETAIVGDAGGCFLFNSLNYAITAPLGSYTLDAVALVFAKDRNKPIGVGETEFHVVMAAGLAPFGPEFKAIGVGLELSKRQSWLCAETQGQNAPPTMDSILQIIPHQPSVVNQPPNLYVAVNRINRNYVGARPERRRVIQNLTRSTSFYRILGADGTHFVAEGNGICPGDSFFFYHRSLETANTTNAIAFNTLRMLKQKTTSRHHHQDHHDEDIVVSSNGVFGGLVFSCKTRGAPYFGVPNAETSLFSQNFPGVPLAGVFCKGEIGRGSSTLISEIDRGLDLSPPNCCLHSCSAVYLVFSYAPPADDHE